MKCTRNRAATRAAVLVALFERSARAQGVQGGASAGVTVDPAVAASRGELGAQARAASSRGEHARALEMAQRALELGGDPSLRALAAESHLALRQPAQAFGQAELCLQQLASAPAGSEQRRAHERCAHIARTARGRVGFVRIAVAEGQRERVRVRVNGVVVPQPLLGQPFAVDPGAVRVEFTLSAGATATLTQPYDVRAGQLVDVPFSQDDALTLATSAPNVTIAPVEPVAEALRVAAARAANAAAPRDRDRDDDVPPARAAAADASANSAAPRVSAGPIVFYSLAGAGLVLGGVSLAMREQGYADARAAGCRVDNSTLLCPSEQAAAPARGADMANGISIASFSTAGLSLVIATSWLVYDLLRPRESAVASGGPARDAGNAGPRRRDVGEPEPSAPRRDQAPSPQVRPIEIPLSRAVGLGVYGVF